MSRRGDNIHKRKDGRWEGRYKSGYKSNGDVKYSSVYARSYTECKNKLEQAKLSNTNHTTITTKLNFSNMLELWYDSNKIRLKRSTQIKYLNLIQTHIAPTLGEIKISQLSATTINAFLDEKLKEGGIKNGKNLSHSYVKTMAIIIEATINFAVAEGYCQPLSTPIYKPQTTSKEFEVLTLSEETKLIEFLKKNCSNASIGTMIALQTGMRIGEVCALRWKDVDLENDVIHIRHTVSRVNDENKIQKTKLILDTPKTNSSRRDVPICQELKKVLLDASEHKKSEFVVSNSPKFISTRTFDYQYRKLLENNDFKVVNFHSLRHTFATRCAKSGIDAKTLSKLLGHSNANTTLNIYVHPSLEIMKEQIDKVYCRV